MANKYGYQVINSRSVAETPTVQVLNVPDLLVVGFARVSSERADGNSTHHPLSS